MRATPLQTASVVSAGRTFVDVIIRKQTYRNLVYVLLTFPLGLFYFTVLFMGFTFGIGLTIVLVGIPILIATLVAIGLLTRVERWLTTNLLNIEIPPVDIVEQTDSIRATGIRGRLIARLTTPATWRGLLYLLVVAGTGWIWFVLVGSLLMLGVVYLSTPLFDPVLWSGVYSDQTMFAQWPSVSIDADVWIAETVGAIVGSFIDLSIKTGTVMIDTRSEAFLFAVGGAVLVLITLHLSNGIARGLGALARILLRPEADT